jgi:hypothetical protein
MDVCLLIGWLGRLGYDRAIVDDDSAVLAHRAGTSHSAERSIERSGLLARMALSAQKWDDTIRAGCRLTRTQGIARSIHPVVTYIVAWSCLLRTQTNPGVCSARVRGCCYGLSGADGAERESQNERSTCRTDKRIGPQGSQALEQSAFILCDGMQHPAEIPHVLSFRRLFCRRLCADFFQRERRQWLNLFRVANLQLSASHQRFS